MPPTRTVLFLSIGLIVIISYVGYRYFFIANIQQTPITLATLDPNLRDQIINTLANHFNTNVQLESVEQLTQAERRNLVLRIKISNSTESVPEFVIFKQSLMKEGEKDDKEAFSRFARDWAGLAFISNLKTTIPITPQFYGGNTQYRFILLEDLGTHHISLLDYLKAHDIHAATSRLEQFMRCLGQLHANSYGKTDEYLKILHTINPHTESYQDHIAAILENLEPKFESMLQQLNLPYTQQLQEEIQTVIHELLTSGPFTTLIHGDCCPDNTFYNQERDQLLLIDFEWGYVRNALLDGTYLRMCMPNCWAEGSAGVIPGDMLEHLELLYRQELMKTIPAARSDDAYHAAYVHACAYWMLKAALIIPHVLHQEDTIRSRLITELQAFSDIAKQYKMLPYLNSITERIIQELKVRWPEIKTLGLYPAFISSSSPVKTRHT